MTTTKIERHVIITRKGADLIAYSVGISHHTGADYRSFVGRERDEATLRATIAAVYPEADNEVTTECISHGAWLKREGR